MAGKPQVTLTFAGDASKLEKTFQQVGSSAQDMVRDVDKSSKKIVDSGKSLDKFGEAADTADTRAMGFRDTMTGVQDTMGGVAAIAKGDLFSGFFQLGAGIGDLGSGIYNFLVPSLKSAVGGMKAAGAATKAFTLSLLTNPIFLVVSALALLGLGLATAYKHSEGFRNGVNAVWNAIKAVIVPVLETIWNAVKTTFEGFITVITKVIKFLPGGNKLIEKLGEVTKGAGDAMKDTGPAAETWEDAQKRLNDQVDQANKTIQDQLDLLDKWYGEVKSQQEAEIGFAQAVDDTAQSIKDNGKTVDIHTEKGRNNRKSLLDLAQANKDLVDAMRANGATSDKLVTQNEAGRRKFLEVAAAMKLPKGEAKALADQLFRIPEATTTNINVNNKTANSRITETTRLLKNVPTYRTVEVKFTTSGVPLNVIGSVGRRASGGPVSAGMPYVVGEHGPELIVPSSNGTVVPNHALGGGDTYVYVEIDGEQLQGRIVKTVRDSNRDLKRKVGAK